MEQHLRRQRGFPEGEWACYGTIVTQGCSASYRVSGRTHAFFEQVLDLFVSCANARGSTLSVLCIEQLMFWMNSELNMHLALNKHFVFYSTRHAKIVTLTIHLQQPVQLKPVRMNIWRRFMDKQICTHSTQEKKLQFLSKLFPLGLKNSAKLVLKLETAYHIKASDQSGEICASEKWLKEVINEGLNPELKAAKFLLLFKFHAAVSVHSTDWRSVAETRLHFISNNRHEEDDCKLVSMNT